MILLSSITLKDSFPFMKRMRSAKIAIIIFFIINVGKKRKFLTSVVKTVHVSYTKLKNEIMTLVPTQSFQYFPLRGE